MPIEDIRASDRAGIEDLLAGGKWALPGDHPIAALDGLVLGDCRVIALLGPKNAVGSRYFQLYLADASGRLADGLLHAGVSELALAGRLAADELVDGVASDAAAVAGYIVDG